QRLVIARDAVLLHAEPAGVAGRSERIEESVEIDAAGAELAEDPAAPRLDQAGAVRDDGPNALEPRGPERDVPDARPPTAQRLDRIGAADEQVARVDEEVDPGQLEQAVDLCRRLDVRARVRVEDWPEPAGAGQVLRPRKALCEPRPAGPVEAER